MFSHIIPSLASSLRRLHCSASSIQYPSCIIHNGFPLSRFISTSSIIHHPLSVPSSSIPSSSATPSSTVNPSISKPQLVKHVTVTGEISRQIIEENSRIERVKGTRHAVNQLEVEAISKHPIKIPRFKSGDTLSFKLKAPEFKSGEQVVTGMIIAHRRRGLGSNVTVRYNAEGDWIEEMIPLYSPQILSINVVSRGVRVRRAKLYYVRKLAGNKNKMRQTSSADDVDDDDDVGDENDEKSVSIHPDLKA